MNPFDRPPSGPPVALPDPADQGPRRGRMAAVAVLTAALLAGGVAGVSQLASADDPDLRASSPDEPLDTVPDDTVPDDTVPDESVPDDETGDESDDEPIDGEIVLDLGDDEPIVLDLDELGTTSFEELAECIGLPAIDLDLGAGAWQEWEPGDGPFGDLDGALAELFEDLPALDDLELGEFAIGDGLFDGSSVTVAGPDGVSVVDLGENGSVTVTRDGDDVTIDTSGDATVRDLDELFGDVGAIFDDRSDGELGELDGRLGDLLDEFLGGVEDGAFDEFVDGLPAFDQLPEVETIDPDQVQTCLDRALGR